MAARFPGAVPEAIWTIGEFWAGGVFLHFPCETEDPFVICGPAETSEAALELFDQRDVRVWLEIQPGDADVAELIRLVLEHYGHHPSVVGLAVDLAWWQSGLGPFKPPLPDEEAARWVELIRSYDPDFRLLLKDSSIKWMPPTARDGILFVDQSHEFEGFDQMLAEFVDWGQHFAPAPVGFLYGCQEDRSWWSGLPDPPGDIGRAILEGIPNSSALFWADLTLLEVLPANR
jgi:hypothetical protein